MAKTCPASGLTAPVRSDYDRLRCRRAGHVVGDVLLLEFHRPEDPARIQAREFVEGVEVRIGCLVDTVDVL